MPTMADVVVKKYDNATNVTFVAKQPSSGDAVNAVWRLDGSSAPYLGLKPEFKLASRWNAARDARRVDFSGSFPSWATNSTTGVSGKIGTVVVTGSIVCPQLIPSADIDEAVAQLTNMLVSTLVRDSLRQGFAPT